MSTFGAGPIIASSIDTLRAYDLATGTSEVPQYDGRTFSDGAADLSEGRRLTWDFEQQSHSEAVMHYQVFGFEENTRFAFAWDPDVGVDAGDDRSGFDELSGLVYAYDAEQAVGILIESDERVTRTGVQQFGSRRMAAPGSPDGIGPGIALIRSPDDVQFVITSYTARNAQGFRVRLLLSEDVATSVATARAITRN